MDDESPAGALLIDSISATLCAHMLRHYSNLALRQCRFPRPDGALGKTRSRRVFDYIQCNMEKKITLGDLAAEACLSPYHFARAFKTLTGVPPHRYVVEKKLEYGRKLLSDGSVPICGIAQRLRFSSQSHFSRLFKNQFGATPGEYRASCS